MAAAHSAFEMGSMQAHGLSANLSIIDGRLDDETEADRVSMSLEPNLDRQIGCIFTVYTSGSVIDGIYADDRSANTT